MNEQHEANDHPTTELPNSYGGHVHHSGWGCDKGKDHMGSCGWGVEFGRARLEAEKA